VLKPESCGVFRFEYQRTINQSNRHTGNERERERERDMREIVRKSNITTTRQKREYLIMFTKTNKSVYAYCAKKTETNA
jgi:hypothetical protein